MTNLAPKSEQNIRTLQADEVDAVTGGIMGGCIRLPTLLITATPQPKPFVDQFASILPSWVHPL